MPDGGFKIVNDGKNAFGVPLADYDYKMHLEDSVHDHDDADGHAHEAHPMLHHASDGQPYFGHNSPMHYGHNDHHWGHHSYHHDW